MLAPRVVEAELVGAGEAKDREIAELRRAMGLLASEQQQQAHSFEAAAASLRGELSALSAEKQGLQAALASTAADGRALASGSESEIASLVKSHVASQHGGRAPHVVAHQARHHSHGRRRHNEVGDRHVSSVSRERVFGSSPARLDVAIEARRVPSSGREILSSRRQIANVRPKNRCNFRIRSLQGDRVSRWYARLTA